MATEKYLYVKSYFSPGRDPQENICGFIQKTEETLDFSVFSFTDGVIADILKKRIAEKKIKVRGVVDADQASQTSMAKILEELKAAGAEIRADREPGLMHNKYAISDGKAVITGSYNWTVRAEKRNRENLVIIRKPTKKANKVVDQVLKLYQANFQEIWDRSAPPTNTVAPPSPPPTLPSPHPL
jgi:phosphatidylserine/phosphatidylglycerophosphate/cardiolipin synthase-like enzyme